jgi:hypothetical protein
LKDHIYAISLLKLRRVNGLRSNISNDFVPDNHVEERGYRGSSRRNSSIIKDENNQKAGKALSAIPIRRQLQRPKVEFLLY